MIFLSLIDQPEIKILDGLYCTFIHYSGTIYTLNFAYILTMYLHVYIDFDIIWHKVVNLLSINLFLKFHEKHNLAWPHFCIFSVKLNGV